MDYDFFTFAQPKNQCSKLFKSKQSQKLALQTFHKLCTTCDELLCSSIYVMIEIEVVLAFQRIDKGSQLLQV